jgi:hypothetical protein
MVEYENGRRPSLPGERQQATLQHAFDEKQTAQQQREALIKEQYGPQLAQIVKVASPDIDEKTQARAVDFFAKNIAALPSKSNLGQIRHEDLRRIGEQSLGQAYKFEQTQRDEQASAQPLNEQLTRQTTPSVRPGGPERDYGELQQAHQQVMATQKPNDEQDKATLQERDKPMEKLTGKEPLAADLRAAKESGHAAEKAGPDRDASAPEAAKPETLTGKALLADDLNAAKEGGNESDQSRDPGRSR